MTVMACMAAGVFLGWFICSFMGIQGGLSKFVALVIGALSALGGSMLGEFVLGVAPAAQGVNVSIVIFAAVVAAACLFIGSVVHNWWGA